ncbi:gustatory receptor for sugar taste 64f-like [Culicoides brevitarsis]|uniref:gustatory receptor for sugar taste 64f-like n=1 Tax=Culicoides brevitarsis TaxID=469753 RepID=UPI00307B2A29
MSGNLSFFGSLKANGFNRAISPAILMAQFFGVMPLYNLTANDVMLLEFKLKSWRTAYSIFCIIATIFSTCTAFVLAYETNFEISQISPFIFYALNVYIMIEFFRLARKWPRIMRHWERVENAIVNSRNRNLDDSLSRQLRIVTIVVMICCWTEHLLSIVSALLNMCDTLTYSEDFLKGHLYHLFFMLPYNAPLAAFGKFTNIISTFAWNFMDLFVMLNAIGMATTFKLLSDFIILECKNQHISDKFWSKQHHIYQKIVDLMNELDDETCSINLVSFSNNVYFIIFQLLNSLQSLPVAHAIYFWFSLLFLISRTILICLCAAEIQDQAKRPLIALRKIRSDYWTEQLRRFSEEITNAKIGLTGKKLFFINRSLLLSVAGTIITYELVLIQFHKQDEGPYIEPCDPNEQNATTPHQPF